MRLPSCRRAAAVRTTPSGQRPTATSLLVALCVALLALVAPGPAAAQVAANGPQQVTAGQPAADLSTPGPHVGAGTSALPEVPAAAWLVADAHTGQVLAAQGAHDPRAPASTLKLLTALSLVPQIDPDAQYTARYDDAAVDGSKVGMVEGSTYTVTDLVHGLVLGSGNDTAHALAELAGGLDRAVELMQEHALALGATATVVRNPSGLDHPEQVTTVHDLAVIGLAALDQPWLAEVMTTPRYAFPGAGTGPASQRPTFEVGNRNRLVGGYEGALGLKNGYTQAARGSFVGAAERDGRRYIAAVLTVEGPSWRAARDLLDWAFANPTAPAVGALDGPHPPQPAEQAGADAQQPAPAAVTQVAAVGPSPAVPGWVRALLWVVAALAGTVVALRTRVLVRRRLRARRRARHRALGLSPGRAGTGGRRAVPGQRARGDRLSGTGAPRP